MSLSTVSVGTTATLVCAQNYGRKAVIITPSASVDVYFSFSGDSGVTTSTGVPLAAGAWPFSFDDGDGTCHSAIYAVVASGTASIRVEQILN